ncbi:FMN-binding domain-containing protein [Pedococcus cremeus]|uniref:FMN-binding domain-containing protein n=1 Tax=Pedococcus cremeus TaxID=587636 RepID=A0A1H9QXZ3_9MICO|nr:FMN-binding protein [Pedococcus cremeus]SER65344.1 FMN-binding domain-containing protein [Pedococcus cremeus]
MRRITLWALSTITTLVLLFSYHTSTSSQGASAAPIVAQAGAASNGSGSASGSGSSGSSSGSGSSSSTKTFSGDTAMTQWGPVQVQITVAGGKVTRATALQVPSGNNRDQEINSYAVPVLNQEVVAAQSANIDMISGATVTSDGYLQSVQSAFDKAGL